MATLAQFGAVLDRFGAETIPAVGVAYQKKVTLMVGGCAFLGEGGGVQIVPGLVNFTRVDTGRARGNWQCSAGAPAEGTIDEGFGPPRKKGGGSRPADFVGAPATPDEQARAEAALAGLQFGQTTYWTNNLPYIAVLNDGGVNRQADHMVERAVATTRMMLGG